MAKKINPKKRESKWGKATLFLILGILSIFLLILLLGSYFFTHPESFKTFKNIGLNSISSMTGFAVLDNQTSDENHITPEIPEVEAESIEEIPEVVEELLAEVINETIKEPIPETNETEINKTLTVIENETVVEDSNATENITKEVINETVSEINVTIEENVTETTPVEAIPEIINKTIEIVPELIIENLTGKNATISTIQYSAVIGQPVKWKKHISLEEPKNFTLKLPAGSKNITVKKIKENKDKEIISSKITGAVMGGGSEGFLSKLFKKIFRLTGGTIGIGETQEVEVELDNTATEYEVEYETPAPYAIEEDTEEGKKVKIVGPENIHYENILSFTELNENLNIVNPSKIKIYWVENESYVPVQKIEDKNSNGIYDYVEWITPHLSEQTFIIELHSENITDGYGLEGHETYPIRGSKKYERCLKVDSPINFNYVKIKAKVEYVESGGDLYYEIYSHDYLNDEPEIALGNCNAPNPIKAKGWESCEINLTQNSSIYWVCAYSLTGNISTNYYNIYWNNQDTNKKRAFWTGSSWQKMDEASYTMKAEFRGKK